MNQSLLITFLLSFTSIFCVYKTSSSIAYLAQAAARKSAQNGDIELSKELMKLTELSELEARTEIQSYLNIFNTRDKGVAIILALYNTEELSFAEKFAILSEIFDHASWKMQFGPLVSAFLELACNTNYVNEKAMALEAAGIASRRTVDVVTSILDLADKAPTISNKTSIISRAFRVASAEEKKEILIPALLELMKLPGTIADKLGSLALATSMVNWQKIMADWKLEDARIARAYINLAKTAPVDQKIFILKQAAAVAPCRLIDSLIAPAMLAMITAARTITNQLQLLQAIAQPIPITPGIILINNRVRNDRQEYENKLNTIIHYLRQIVVIPAIFNLLNQTKDLLSRSRILNVAQKLANECDIIEFASLRSSLRNRLELPAMSIWRSVV